MSLSCRGYVSEADEQGHPWACFDKDGDVGKPHLLIERAASRFALTVDLDLGGDGSGNRG